MPESVKVERWRLEEFLRLGFDVDAAQDLADSSADLRGVESLLARGAGHELAAKIAL